MSNNYLLDCAIVNTKKYAHMYTIVDSRANNNTNAPLHKEELEKLEFITMITGECHWTLLDVLEYYARVDIAYPFFRTIQGLNNHKCVCNLSAYGYKNCVYCITLDHYINLFDIALGSNSPVFFNNLATHVFFALGPMHDSYESIIEVMILCIRHDRPYFFKYLVDIIGEDAFGGDEYDNDDGNDRPVLRLDKLLRTIYDTTKIRMDVTDIYLDGVIALLQHEIYYITDKSIVTSEPLWECLVSRCVDIDIIGRDSLLHKNGAINYDIREYIGDNPKYWLDDDSNDKDIEITNEYECQNSDYSKCTCAFIA